jgi:hypothetical protein
MNYLKVALYNGAHEASYYYYRRELYPREIGAQAEQRAAEDAVQDDYPVGEAPA